MLFRKSHVKIALASLISWPMYLYGILMNFHLLLESS